MKIIESRIKLNIKAQEANPSPPIGPVLGSKGINIMKFCNDFNSKTKSITDLTKGTLVSVVISIYSDKSFDFIIKSTPTSVLLKDVLSLNKGSSKPNKDIVGTLTSDNLNYIISKKQNDLFVNSKEKAIKTILGTAKSMGIVLEGIK